MPFFGPHRLRRALAAATCVVLWALLVGGGGRAVAHAQAPPDTMRMALSEVVRLAMAHNRTVENARLNRRADRYDRRVAADKFVPDLNVRTELNTSDSFVRDGALPRTDRAGRDLRAGATLTQLLPTGTRLSVGYEGVGDRSTTDRPGGVSLPDSVSARAIDYRQNVQVRVEQPLLQDFGLGVNRASVEIAKLQDASSRQDLKSALIGTVTQTVIAYRAYVQARERQAIARKSLTRAQQLLRRNRRLVEAGRMASLDLVQGRTQVSRQQLALEEARTQLESARLTLLEILDLNREAIVVPIDSLGVPDVSLDTDSLVRIALDRRPDYQRVQNAVGIAREDRRLATNRRLWDVRLVGTYNRRLEGDRFHLPYRGDPFSVQGGWNVGLTVERTLGNPRREQRREQSRLQAQIAGNRKTDLRQQIRIAVRDQVNTLRQRRRQLDLAREVRRLSARKLAVEEKKLDKGRSSNFQVVVFQNDLTRARQRELQARIAYLNAVTRLDQLTGSTLRTWGIELDALQ